MGSDAGQTMLVWRNLSEYVVCPDCRQRLTLDTDAFLCSCCGRSYPIVQGIPRFVATEEYVGNFGYEWTKHAQTQLDGNGNRTTEEQFRNILGIAPEYIRGKLVLDAGCGMGRYAEVASRYGGRVIGVDLSRAVESAHANLAGRENVQILQANLFRLPFADESFDFIYSIGVLHHTRDCQGAFRALARLLKPGGKIVIWVYSAYGKRLYLLSDLYRKVTTGLPHRLLYALCHVAVPLYYVQRSLARLRLSAVARFLWWLLPVSDHPDWRWRVLDTFDWYSPRYQSKHTYEQVFPWFESEGLINLRVLGQPVGVMGEKPRRH